MDGRRMAVNAWEEGQLGMNEVFSSFGNGGATNWKTLALNSSEQIQNLQKPKVTDCTANGLLHRGDEGPPAQRCNFTIVLPLIVNLKFVKVIYQCDFHSVLLALATSSSAFSLTPNQH